MLYFLVQPGSRLYYRKFSIRGLENFPKKNLPTILISNHQNGMMDAIMLCITAPRQLHFLTRADIFKNPRMSKILRSLNMLPVYRERDRVGNLVEENAAIFEEAHRRVAAGNLLALFPEGNHNNQKCIRPFRKGVSRVAIGSLETLDFKEEVYIVPVGLDYSNYTDFQSDLLLSFGPPIPTKQFADSYRQEPAKTLNLISKLAYEGLKEQCINIEDKKNYSTIKNLLPLCMVIEGNGRIPKKHYDRLKSSQRATAVMSDLLQSPDADSFMALAKSFLQLAEKLEIDVALLNTRGSFMRDFARFIAVPLLFIPIMTGVVLNFIPALLVTSFVKKKVRDPHFKSSITLGLGVFVFPVFWLFFSLLAWLFTSSLLITFATPLAALICGFITSHVWNGQKKVTAQSKIVRARKRKSADFTELMRLNKELISLLNQHKTRFDVQEN